ncbi:hypothetical protein LWF15_33535 [Kineosporia rhizophila]|uniref:hypothetical protein n=1 Tax=Kineosporia rhizophila TaxID=84633 RepID=UPI001E5142A2|nr:hypothetical protein [Kineosporia rhizophila]MCE0540428.1 hypothetical protein [Kineosporia rhizophila]
MDAGSTSTAYAQGRRDYAAGSIDTSRGADRAYLAGIRAERSDAIDRELTAWQPVQGTPESS